MLKKLMLILFLGLVMSGPAAPILKSYFVWFDYGPRSK